MNKSIDWDDVAVTSTGWGYGANAQRARDSKTKCVYALCFSR
jgi:hypothetical protein